MIVTLDSSGNGMGVGFVQQALVSGMFTANGVSAGARVRGMFNAALSGTFAATLTLERSLDNGATWNPLTAGGFSQQFAAPCEEIYDEPENQAMYRWRCSNFVAGPVLYRISQ